MDEILFNHKKPPKDKPPADPHTIDMFTGEPLGAPPPAPAPPPPVLDAAAGREKAEAGMGLASENQGEDWKKAMLARVRLSLKKREKLTVDDVWVDIGRGPRTHSEGSAMGAVMREAAKRNWCRKSRNEFIRSERADNHGAIRPVWISLIYEGPEVRHG